MRPSQEGGGAARCEKRLSLHAGSRSLSSRELRLLGQLPPELLRVLLVGPTQKFAEQQVEMRLNLVWPYSVTCLVSAVWRAIWEPSVDSAYVLTDQDAEHRELRGRTSRARCGPCGPTSSSRRGA